MVRFEVGSFHSDNSINNNSKNNKEEIYREIYRECFNSIAQSRYEHSKVSIVSKTAAKITNVSDDLFLEIIRSYYVLPGIVVFVWDRKR